MSMTSFTVEGDAILGYFASRPFKQDRSVSLVIEGSEEELSVEGEGLSLGTSIEHMIARNLNFPNDEEFEANSDRMRTLRETGLRPAEGVPDIIRPGTRLRVTVEVID